METFFLRMQLFASNDDESAGDGADGVEVEVLAGAAGAVALVLADLLRVNCCSCLRVGSKNFCEYSLNMVEIRLQQK